MKKILTNPKYLVVLAAMALGLGFAYSNCASNNNSSSAAAANSVINITPATVTLNEGGTQTFVSTGGSGIYTYSVTSGTGTINSSTGVYVAPVVGESDTVQVADTLGNISYAYVTVNSTSGTYLYYQCPLNLSQSGCTDISQCESTCLGNYSANQVCNWYNSNMSAISVSCTLVSSLSPAYSCPTVSSANCASATACESSCVGQIQAGPTCTIHGTNGSSNAEACANMTGRGSVQIYYCPIAVSQSGCTNTSVCQSTCVGQYTTQPYCVYYNANQSFTQVPCSAVTTLTF